MVNLLLYSPLSLELKGGGERWISEVIPRLLENEIKVTLVTTNFLPKGYRRAGSSILPSELSRPNFDFTPLRVHPLSKLVNFPIITKTSFSKLEGLFSSHDIMYFMNAYAFQDLLIWMARLLGGKIPIICSQHSALFHSSKLHNMYASIVTRSVLPRFQAYHVLNKKDFEIYKNWGLKDVFLIPNGVNIERFRPLQGRSKGKTMKILYVGRLDYQKGIDVLLKSLDLIDADEEFKLNVLIEICGTGPLSEHVSMISSQNSLVNYLGYVSDDELINLYQQADLFIMPSRVETFGLVALEAMASGLPIIATDIPGPHSIVDSSFGVLIEPGNSLELVSAINRFYEIWMSNSGEFERMSRNARRRCEEKYSWDSIAARIANMCKAVANSSENSTISANAYPH